jgi:DNA invertase Pin-like site-specific DNA recombinase
LQTPRPESFAAVGDARCSTDEQDLTAQRDRLHQLGVAEDRVYLDHGLTGTTRARRGLDQALAAVREGDTLIVTKLDRLARSVPDARAIGDELAARGIKLSLGGQVYDPTDPMGRCSTRSWRSSPSSKSISCGPGRRRAWPSPVPRGKLRGRAPKLSAKQQRELVRMYGTGEYTIADLADVFTVSRATVYRTLQRGQAPQAR